jgi:hypothetical protein
VRISKLHEGLPDFPTSKTLDLRPACRLSSGESLFRPATCGRPLACRWSLLLGWIFLPSSDAPPVAGCRPLAPPCGNTYAGLSWRRGCMRNKFRAAHQRPDHSSNAISFKLPSVHDYMSITSSAGNQLNHDENLIQPIREVRSLHGFEQIERLPNERSMRSGLDRGLLLDLQHISRAKSKMSSWFAASSKFCIWLDQKVREKQKIRERLISNFFIGYNIDGALNLRTGEKMGRRRRRRTIAVGVTDGYKSGIFPA